MKNLKKLERAAMEAVARRFSATWENSSDIYLTVAGKRVGVDIRTLKRHGRANASKPHLRFDKVVIWLMGRLQTALDKIVPDGLTVLLTVTAPIRLPSKTAASLEDKVQTLLGRGSKGRDVKGTIHGNGIHIRLLRNKSEQAPKMIGFVHNPDTDPLLLFKMTGELIELHSAEGTGDRWLVVISAEGMSCLEAYRYIYSQLRMTTNFEKILMVFSDGRVGILKG